MPNEANLLPNYSECEHSLFISYAHDDDVGHNGWVTALRDALLAHLVGKLPRGIKRHPIHLSQDNGPTSGPLGRALRERIRKSFAVLLVVGDRYVDSRWCERELEFYMEAFGPAGNTSRLFVVAMSESARKAVKDSPVWQRVVDPDQIFVCMYDPADASSPIPARTDKGTISETMHKACGRIADPLIEEIKRNVAVDGRRPSRPDEGKGEKPPGPLCIAIAPHTENLTTHVSQLRKVLEGEGATVHVLDRQLFHEYDPDAKYPLGTQFAAAHALVAPISAVRPMRPDRVGGHVSLLLEEWAKLRKSRPIVWYQPDIPIAPDARALDKHLEVFKQLDPVFNNERAIVNHLFSTSSTPRVYIEKHPQVPAYWLSNELNAAWKALPPEPGRPPALDCRFIELTKISSADDDAAAVVLLMPEGLKDLEALKAQIERVRRAFPRDGAYPGVVACIFNPPPRQQPGLVHDWGEVHYYRCQQPRGGFETDEFSKRWLNEFVQQIWHQYKGSREPDAQLH